MIHTQASPVIERSNPGNLPPDLESAYADFRARLIEALQAVDADFRSGAAIVAKLGINRQTAWQLSTIAVEPDAASGLGVLPGARGLRVFVEACERFDTGAHAVRGLQASIDVLEEAVRQHAGDRASLGLLTAASDRDDLELRTEALRRDGFRAQCAMLGLRADTQVRGIVYAPSLSGDPDRLSIAGYQCFGGLMRLRPDRASRLFMSEGGAIDGRNGLEDRAPAAYDLDVALSSAGRDEVESVVRRNQRWSVLRPGPVGRSAAANLAFIGSAPEDQPRCGTMPEGHVHQIAVTSYVPTERLVVDFFIDTRLAEHTVISGSVWAGCFDGSAGAPVLPLARSDPGYLFDLSHPIRHSATDLAGEPTIPGMEQVIERAASRVGTTPDRLVGVRFMSSFAMTPTSVVMSRDAPPDKD